MMKQIIILLTVVILTVSSFSQNINGKLAANGQFIIRDTTNTFLTIPQNTGYLNLNRSLVLPNTTGSTIGVMFKGADRFLHNYGTANTFLGLNSGNFTMTGSFNSAFGSNSLYTNTTGAHNTAFGLSSLYSNTTGYNNTAFGNYSLSSTTTGLENTAVGYNSGFNITTGFNLTCIGNESQPTTPTANNQITLGNNYVASLRCNVTTITSLSDSRDKRNISELYLGIDFLMKLKPRLFNWDKREWYEGNISDGTKMQETPTAGFIAQELDEVQNSENAEWLNLVLKDNPEKWEATPGNLFPIVVKAIQELKTENDGLKTENSELKERLSKLEQMQTVLAVEIEKMKSKNSDPKEIKLGEK